MFPPWWPTEGMVEKESELEKEARLLQNKADKTKEVAEMLSTWLKEKKVPKKEFEKLHNIAKGLTEDSKTLQEDATAKAREAREEKEEKERAEQEKKEKEAKEKAEKEKREKREKEDEAASNCHA